MKIKKIRQFNLYLPYIIFAIGVLLLLSYQIQNKITIIVGDGYFHFSRIYDAAQQIKTGYFNYFQTNWGFDQSGRIINAVYGPFFAYLMGLILLICGSWFRFQIVTTFIISMVAVSGMYHVLQKIKPNLVINTLLALTYLFKITTWNNGPTFGAVSYAVFPYIILCAVRMIQNEDKPINWLQLALTMSVVGQIHLMSTMMGALMLVPFAIVGFIQTKNRKSMILNLIGAVGLTLLLTANIWLAISYFKFIDPLGNPIGTNMANSTINFAELPFLLNVFMLAQLIYVVFNFKRSKLNTTITLVALVFILMGSALFPWNWIQTEFPVLKETFQVPRRFFIIGFSLIVAASTITIQNLLKAKVECKYAICGFVLVVLLANFNYSLRVNSFYGINSSMNKPVQKITYSSQLGELFKYINMPAPDYLPENKKMEGSEKAKIYQLQLINHKNSFNHQVQKDGTLKLTWQAKKDSKTQLPIVMYRRSKLNVNQKYSYISKNEIGMPVVRQHKGLNEAVLAYQAPSWWKVMLIIVALSWLCVIIYLVYLKCRRL
ncbi:hypothetical protein [uncultured Lactobacillus sp.]|uniref:hypothetical protein n=1 Tax=uncultured Lactobacillus sp. TaxID=153152 RepID=UPI0026386C54|nr:hypothetical protein [uncultured Lactobacillus sp.]